MLAGCKEKAVTELPALEKTLWSAEMIGGKKIADNSKVTMRMDGGGRIYGSAGCNRYMGHYELNGANLQVNSMLGATRMACAEEKVMAQEQAFLDLIQQTKDYEITPDGKLIVKANYGKAIVFAPDADQNSGK